VSAPEPPEAGGAAPGDPIPADQGPGLLRTARGLAIATVVSRVTGFARIAALTAFLGVDHVRQAFDVANTLPNTLFELLLGGILTSTLVPLLIEAKAAGPVKAAQFTQRILTLTVIATAVLSLLAVLAAPVLVHAFNKSPDAGEIALTVQWARFFLPQIFFYALTGTISAVLNANGRFGAAVWAPVLNNAVVIATLGVFALLPGPTRVTVRTLTSAQLVTLGVGTTLGVVAMAAVLLPVLRSTGFRWRLSLDLRGVGLRRMAKLGAWVLVYVAATQIAYWVLTRLATGVEDQPTYLTAFTVWQLPHAVVAVSLITALLPRMSAHALAGNLSRLRSDLDRALRLSVIVLLPAAVAFMVLGRDITTVLFNHRVTTLAQAERMGWVLAVFAVGLLPFSVYQLQARAFYAMQDTRTPSLVQCAVSAVLIAVDLLLAWVLPNDLRVFGLAAGHAAAYVVGVMISGIALRRRLGPRPGAGGGGRFWPGLTLVTRLVPAAGLAAAAAAAASVALHQHLPSGPMASFVVLAVAGTLGGAVYLGVIIVLRIPEARAGLRSLRLPGA
jgi:putative peptidoglycan lipid II flippase